MCRMCLLTATEIPGLTDAQRVNVVHEAMMRASVEDGFQRDGWGVTDMHDIWKLPDFYLDCSPTWLKDIDSSGFIMSHLRKASAQTARTRSESHPYAFVVGNDVLTAQHNGWFEGTDWSRWRQDNPNTDSWRAFDVLASMLQKHPNMDTELLNAWLSTFGDSSAYALMMHWKDEMHIIRGKHRTMTVMQVGNGFLFNTSGSVLKIMKSYLNDMYGVKAGDIKVMPENLMLTVKAGVSDFVEQTLAPVHVHKVYTQRWETAPNPKPVIAETLSAEGNGAAVDVTEEPAAFGFIIAPAVTRTRVPRHTVSAAGTAASTVPITTRDAVKDLTKLKDRRTMLSSFAGKFTPLRRELTMLWGAWALGYMAENVELCNVVHFTLSTNEVELELLTNVLCPESTTDERFHSLTPLANNMINWWNRIVLDGHDAELHLKLFGVEFFWMDTKWLRLAGDTRLDMAIAFARWQRYMLGKFSQLTKAEFNQWVDRDRVANAIAENPAEVLV